MLTTKVNANLAIRFVIIDYQIKIIKGSDFKTIQTDNCFLENQNSYYSNNGINTLVNLIKLLSKSQKEQLKSNYCKQVFQPTLIKVCKINTKNICKNH